jgi:hypothetical protein
MQHFFEICRGKGFTQCVMAPDAADYVVKFYENTEMEDDFLIEGVFL